MSLFQTAVDRTNARCAAAAAHVDDEQKTFVGVPSVALLSGLDVDPDEVQQILWGHAVDMLARIWVIQNVAGSREEEARRASEEIYALLMQTLLLGALTKEAAS